MAAIAAASFVLVEFLAIFGVFDMIENTLRDVRFASLGQSPPPEEILLVDFPDWPVPRSQVADVIRALYEGGAKAIALDILLDYPTTEADDAALEAALKDTEGVILGEELIFLKGGKLEAVTPLERFARHAWGIGFTNLVVDPYDKVVREAQLVAGDNAIYKSLACLAAARGLGLASPGDVAATQNGVRIGVRRILTSRAKRILIGYFGGREAFDPETGKSVVFTAEMVHNLRELGLLHPSDSPFAGHSVIVGSLSPHTRDIHRTPFDEAAISQTPYATPGIIIQANILGDLIRPERIIPDYRQYGTLTTLIVALLFAAAFGFLGRTLGAVLGALAVSGAVVLQLYSFPAVSISLIGSTATIPLTFLASLYYKSILETRAKEHLRNLFGYYLSADLAKAILADPGLLKLGGERIECTFLFCDINKFSTISEGLEPEEVVALLNVFFGEMNESVIAYRGWLNKFLGDGVIVVFGALSRHERHASQAVRSALDMKRRIARMRGYVRERFGIEGFGATIGIHSGPASVGNIGSPQRMEYTVIGDAVNVCERIAQQAKELGIGIAVSQEVFQSADDCGKFTEIGVFPVKGRTQPVTMYEVVESDALKQPPKAASPQEQSGKIAG